MDWLFRCGFKLPLSELETTCLNVYSRKKPRRNGAENFVRFASYVELPHSLLTLLRYVGAGAGTLVLHGAIALVLPSRSTTHEAVASPTLMWMDATSLYTSGGDAIATQGHLATPGDEVPHRPRTPRKARAREAKAASPKPEASEQNVAAAAQEANAASTAAAGNDAESRPSLVDTPPFAAHGASGDGGQDGAASGAGRGPQSHGTGASSLAHGPGLLVTGRPCAGFFPRRARANHGEVQLSVDVDAEGHAHPSAILLEEPRGQGFGPAARDCAEHLRFRPAVDEHGRPVPGQAKLKLSFDRASSA